MTILRIELEADRSSAIIHVLLWIWNEILLYSNTSYRFLIQLDNIIHAHTRLETNTNRKKTTLLKAFVFNQTRTSLHFKSISRLEYFIRNKLSNKFGGICINDTEHHSIYIRLLEWHIFGLLSVIVFYVLQLIELFYRKHYMYVFRFYWFRINFQKYVNVILKKCVFFFLQVRTHVFFSSVF